MAALTHHFVAILIFLLSCSWVLSCDCCTFHDIMVSTVPTGRVIQGRPEWNVVVNNDCNCAQSQITLFCSGFQTVVPVGLQVLNKLGDTCLINGGRPLGPHTILQFNYAWDYSFDLTSVSSVVGPCF